MPALYLVATPIGNLEDITIRAVSVLKECDVVAVETPDRARILLDRIGARKPLIICREDNREKSARQIIESIKDGKSVALVSDSGMPAVCDPGSFVVRKAVEENIDVIPVPGPSAVITALAVSGFDSSSFVFEGFLPRRDSKRKKALERFREEERTVVIYESPHRILSTLKFAEEILGDRNVVVCRELTKKYEEIIRGKINVVLERLKTKEPKGEFVVVIEGE